MKIKNVEIIKQEQGIIILSYEGFLTSTLDLNKKYDIQVEEHGKQRTKDQNALLWKLIDELAKKTKNDKWAIYVEALKQANIKGEYILALPAAKQSLEQVYRVVEALDETREVNGKQLTIFKCYIGSSKLNTKEFSQFTEYILRLCAENGILVESI